MPFCVSRTIVRNQRAFNMKSLVVVLLVIVAAESRQVCIPNSQFKMDCNTCFCNTDGTSMGCTFMLCSPQLLNEDSGIRIVKRSYETSKSVYGRTCEPGTIVKRDCNSCHCTSFGTIGRCTRMFCGNDVDEDRTLKINRQDKVCEPGRVYRLDRCNRCFCNKYGTRSSCTNRICGPNMIDTEGGIKI